MSDESLSLDEDVFVLSLLSSPADIGGGGGGGGGGVSNVVEDGDGLVRAGESGRSRAALASFLRVLHFS